MADDDPDDIELDALEPDEQPEVAADEPEEPEQPEPEPTTETGEPQPETLRTGETQPERQPSRRDARIQTLTEQIRERDQRLAETNRRIDDLIRQQGQLARPQGETPEQRAARFALMTPQEQISETLRESEARHTAQMQQFQMQSLDVADRTAFQAKAAVDPLYAKWGPKVEGRLAELRAKGNNVEREVLLKFLIGEAALERRTGKEGRREVAQAQRRVAAQRTRPQNSGSDTQNQRRQQGTSLERRLENIQI